VLNPTEVVPKSHRPGSCDAEFGGRNGAVRELSAFVRARQLMAAISGVEIESPRLTEGPFDCPKRDRMSVI